MSGKWFFRLYFFQVFSFPHGSEHEFDIHQHQPAAAALDTHFSFLLLFCDFFAAATQFGVFLGWRRSTLSNDERDWQLITNYHHRQQHLIVRFYTARKETSSQYSRNRILYFVYLSDLSPYSSHSCVPFVLRNLKLQQPKRKKIAHQQHTYIYTARTNLSRSRIIYEWSYLSIPPYVNIKAKKKIFVVIRAIVDIFTKPAQVEFSEFRSFRLSTEPIPISIELFSSERDGWLLSRLNCWHLLIFSLENSWFIQHWFSCRSGNFFTLEVCLILRGNSQ